MAGFRTVIIVTRRGVPVPFAECVFGDKGEFTADQNGELEIELDDWGIGRTIVISFLLSDPRDGTTITVYRRIPDGAVSTIEMTLGATYKDTGAWTPPTP